MTAEEPLEEGANDTKGGITGLSSHMFFLTTNKKDFSHSLDMTIRGGGDIFIKKDFLISIKRYLTL